MNTKENILSVFIDESGDFGEYCYHSPYYMVAMVLHEQRHSLSNEINMLRALEHPGLPSLHDVFTEGNKIFIVMELVEGETLEQYVKARGKLSIKETLYITECLCETVGYLHSRSVPVVHGDLKPQNIIVREGRVSLVDLGGAMKIYGNSQICMGTPGYAPPELAQGKITKKQLKIPDVDSDFGKAAAREEIIRSGCGSFRRRNQATFFGTWGGRDCGRRTEYESFRRGVFRGLSADQCRYYICATE